MKAMNFGRIAAAAVVAWIVSIGLGYLANNVLLADLYQANAAAYRSVEEMTSKLPIGFCVQLIGFFAFAYAYAKGYEGGNGIAEGVRFGLLIAVMLVSFAIVWNYVVQPISASLAFAQVGDYLIEGAIYGTIVGVIYKPYGMPA